MYLLVPKRKCRNWKWNSFYFPTRVRQLDLTRLTPEKEPTQKSLEYPLLRERGTRVEWALASVMRDRIGQLGLKLDITMTYLRGIPLLYITIDIFYYFLLFWNSQLVFETLLVTSPIAAAAPCWCRLNGIICDVFCIFYMVTCILYLCEQRTATKCATDRSANRNTTERKWKTFASK